MDVGTGETRAEDVGPVVAVTYLMDRDEVRKAARVAARVLPARRKLKRMLAVLMVVGVGVFASGVTSGRFFFTTSGLVLLLMSGLLRSDWYFAYAILRSPVARKFLLQHPNREFRADPDGVTFVSEPSVGSHTWSAVDTVVDHRDAVVFILSSQSFNFVPGSALDASARETVRSIATTAPRGPTWEYAK